MASRVITSSGLPTPIMLFVSSLRALDNVAQFYCMCGRSNLSGKRQRLCGALIEL